MSGATLLEVLVAVAASSVGLLGLAGLMQLSATSNRVAFESTLVELAARSLVDAQHADGLSTEQAFAKLDAAGSTQACVPACSASDRAAANRDRLKAMLAAVPDAAASLQCSNDAPSRCTLRIDWATPSAAGAQRTVLEWVYVP